MRFIPTPNDVKNLKSLITNNRLLEEEVKIANYFIRSMKEGRLCGKYPGRLVRSKEEDEKMLKNLNILFSPKGWEVYLDELRNVCYKERECN